ncbi:hypothetical protein OQA88_12122 [Cercophora sp. LCS_1]
MLFSILSFAALGLVTLSGASPGHRAGTSENNALNLFSKRESTTDPRIPRSDPSPDYPLKFQVPLPIPPIKQPLKVFTKPNSTDEVWYYEFEIKHFSQQIYPNLNATPLVGYDGLAPGPTIIVPRGTESVVRFVNNATALSSVHLHGSYSRAPWDGWAEDTSAPGQYKTYYFPNQQSARMMWYHDHAVHITADNAYSGQAGVYLIHDPAEDSLNLPSGYGEFDIPLVITSKQYRSDGTLFMPSYKANSPWYDDSLWGDVNHVNGQPWPYLAVLPRLYRFRLLNAAVSRAYSLYLVSLSHPNRKIPFRVIASDSGLLAKPVQTADIYLSSAERYDLIFDFASYAGQTLELRNFPKAGGHGVEQDYSHTNRIMRFNVSASSPAPEEFTVPSSLRTVPFPKRKRGIDHHFKFHRQNGKWMINGVGFGDANSRVLANVPRGTVQIWELENTTDGWSHPIHVHLVDFRILRRRGDRRVNRYESAGLKDVVWLGREEKVLVEAHYAPWDGVYMFHCHNLVHEDDDMMAAFNVTALPGLGYGDTSFADPMAEEWRAKPYSVSDYLDRTGPFSDDGIEDTVFAMVARKPYRESTYSNGTLARRNWQRPGQGPVGGARLWS